MNRGGDETLVLWDAQIVLWDARMVQVKHLMLWDGMLGWCLGCSDDKTRHQSLGKRREPFPSTTRGFKVEAKGGDVPISSA